MVENKLRIALLYGGNFTRVCWDCKMGIFCQKSLLNLNHIVTYLLFHILLHLHIINATNVVMWKEGKMPIISRNALLQSLADTIADYRQGEIRPITPDHVERWLNQFEVEDQFAILTEMDSLMKRFYFSKTRVKECLRNFLNNDLIATHNPLKALPRINFLQIQRTGSSQRAMLGLVDEILQEDYNSSLSACGTVKSNAFVYIDDGVYTGNRLVHDLFKGENAWINEGFRNSRLLIYTIATHIAATNYIEGHITHASQEKSLFAKRIHSLNIDNRRLANSKVEFLWPEIYIGDAFVDGYVSHVRKALVERNWSDRDLFRPLRVPLKETFFSSAEARMTVERAFLTKGSRIITGNKRSAESVRPLGFEVIGSLGFGTFYVTYRNISNNCPLVLWWGEPGTSASLPLGKWYPLFPRRTNSQYNEY